MTPLSGGGFLAAKAGAVRAARGPVHEARLAELEERARRRAAPPSFKGAIAGGPHVAVIAEFKRRSPSAGRLTDEPAADVAAAYVAGGAAALSILTDGSDFGGSLADLAAVCQHCAGTPVLRKDFIVDAAGVCEARLMGAAAVLLIAAMVNAAELVQLASTAKFVGLDALIEVHDEADLERALAAGARLIGINNRDLRSLTTSLAVTERIARLVPPGVLIVGESGVRTAADVARLRDAGAHAVLVGEALLREAPHARAARVRELAQVPR